MIREALASLARQEALGGVIARTPVARELVGRVIGGEGLEEVLPQISELVDRGFHVSVEHVVPQVRDSDGVANAVVGYHELIAAVADSKLTASVEVIVFTEALGQGLLNSDPLSHLLDLSRMAKERDVALHLGVGPLADVAQTLGWAQQVLDEDDPIGVTLPAILRATEQEAVTWANRRVRLVKGAHGDGVSAYRQPIETDKAFVRAAKTLLRGSGQPSFATHDPRLIAIIESLATRYDRAPHTFEFAFYLGRQVAEQERLLAAGHRVRIYVPFGHHWLERLVGGLAEQPTGIGGALRSLLPV